MFRNVVPSAPGVGHRRSADWRLAPAIVAALVAACGGSGSLASDNGLASSVSPSGGGPGGGPGGDVAPVTATVDGTSYAFPIGTCEVREDEVRVSAQGADVLAGVEVVWQGQGGDQTFQVFHTGGTDPQPPAPFELHASPQDADTSWDVRVAGTNAEISLRMNNQLPAAQGDPAVAFYDAVIDVRCDSRGFGGMSPEPADVVDSNSESTQPAILGESTITLTLGGAEYQYDYPGCAYEDASFVVADSSLDRLAVGFGAASLTLPNGTTWSAEGVALAVTGTHADWSGTMSSPSGSEAATIVIEC